MSRRVVIAPAAEADLRAAFTWYEKRLAGPGHEFIRQFEARLSTLQRTPQLFRKRFGPYRLAATRRFPYTIYFIWDESTDLIAVRRVLHFKQQTPRG